MSEKYTIFYHFDKILALLNQHNLQRFHKGLNKVLTFQANGGSMEGGGSKFHEVKLEEAGDEDDDRASQESGGERGERVHGEIAVLSPSQR